ncbi:PREDICTED: uncharacterized protein LOC106342725 isoform X2 [Brassica oleracea var. oleracea]|nr:PREDICTED: uncharacterized protein LOC106342725 isoform X2 [Brassica oleracea var. oleracea]
MGIPVCLGPKGPMKLMSWPYFVQGSYQKLRSSPFPGSIKVHWIAICLTARICLNNHQPEEFDSTSCVPELEIPKAETSTTLRLSNLVPCDSSNIFTLKCTFPHKSVTHFINSVDDFFRRGSQLAVDNFLELSGRPRYRMGREPTGIPVVETMEVVSSSDNPLGKKHAFSTLMASPEKALNSSRTWRTPWTELEEPSVNMRISSAKHKWVRGERVALAQSSGAIEKSMEPPIDVNREGRCRITG